jgi:glycosyltransferase involved in cell wall biosynthesis
MTLYLLISGDFVKTGGMDRANYALADYLARSGADVHLVAHRVAPELCQYANLVWHPVPKPGNSDFLGGFLLDAIGRVWGDRIQRQGGRVIVNGGNCLQPAVNWVHYVHAAYRPEGRGTGWRQLKLWITHAYFCWTERFNLRQAQRVIVNSHLSAQHLVQYQLADAAKIHTVYCGVDPARFYPAASARSLRQALGWPLDQPIVLFIGALSDRRKGLETLLLAWQQLCQDPSWTATLVVAGAGRPQSLSDRVQFLGFRTDMPDLLRAADCLVAPSRYEAYGLAVQEALCCGIPAMVTAESGVAERYPTALKSLLLEDPTDVQQLVQTLRHWQQQSDHYRAIALRLSQQLRRHTWDHMAEHILRLTMQSTTVSVIQR